MGKVKRVEIGEPSNPYDGWTDNEELCSYFTVGDEVTLVLPDGTRGRYVVTEVDLADGVRFSPVKP